MQNNETTTDEYMTAMALRAMRFLPSLDVKEWETLIKFSTTSESVIERLMATETWLYLKHDYSDSLQKEWHREAVINALQNSPSIRLKAHYILILGLYDQQQEAIYDLLNDINDDYLLREAITIAVEGPEIDLFNQQEPKIIREKYYSGKRINIEGDSDYP